LFVRWGFDVTTPRPRFAKLHSQRHVDSYVRLGWVVVRELVAEPPYDNEPYEYLLEWRGPGDPRRPNVEK
jgi:hypothetical protein